MLSRFHLISERNGQTDGRTDGRTDRFAIGLSISRVSMLTCDKKRTATDHYTVIGTLADDWWAVTFGIARRGLGGLWPRPVPSSLYQM